jgi:hypothetical protein
MRRIGTIAWLMLALTACDAKSSKGPKDSFAKRRAQHSTKLWVHRPAPQPYRDEAPPDGVEVVSYPSGPLSLKAWFAHPPGSGRAPALLYFHGGFAFDRDDFEVVRPFVESGFAVMTPMLRGENGNPGAHEHYYGEVDDARAAIAWLRARPDIDPDRVVAFGHSAGGVVSVLVSLYPDSGLRMSGSAGGLYEESIIGAHGVPFDASDSEELALRTPARNVDQLQVRHLAYVGRDDLLVLKGVIVAKEHAPPRLEITYLDGDHVTSLPAAVRSFLAAVTAP